MCLTCLERFNEAVRRRPLAPAAPTPGSDPHLQTIEVEFQTYDASDGVSVNILTGITDVAAAIQGFRLAADSLERDRFERYESSATATTTSISTAPPRGRAATPRADRVWRPASPKTSARTRLAPSTTVGWSWKSGVEAT